MSYAASYRHFRKGYRLGSESVVVLNHFTLDVDSGEFAAIMGPSGTKKTTLLNLGLDMPDGGELTVAGARLDGLRSTPLAAWRAQHVGFVFQLHNLMPLSEAPKVQIPLLLTSLPARERNRRGAVALQLDGDSAEKPSIVATDEPPEASELSDCSKFPGSSPDVRRCR